MGPANTKLSRTAKRTTNIYLLTLDEIRQYDCGSLGNEKFPRQHKQSVSKPSFSEVVHAVQNHCERTGRPMPNFNVEIKSKKSWYDTYVPKPEFFVKTVLQEIGSLKIQDKVTLQSFDVKVLQEVHLQDPEIPISYLTEVNTGIVRAIRLLGFTPSVYSPNYRTLRKKTIEESHARNVKVIPWTVNSVELFEKLIGLGADGIITDYPDLIKG
jgi:glycerophosphoryl diester phosphodiesterase